MRQITCTGLVVFAVLALAAGLASAQGMLLPLTEGDEVELTRKTRVGAIVLQPGRYQLQHQWIEGRHYLVVRSNTTRPEESPQGTRPPDGTGDEVARVACRVVSGGMQQAGTGLTTTLEPDGTSTLTEVRIRGGRRGHVLVLQPQS